MEKNRDKTLNTLRKYITEKQEIFNKQPLPLSVHDIEYNTIFVNQALIDLCGDKANIVNIKCYQLLHENSKPIENCPLAKTIKNRKTEIFETYMPSLKRTLFITTDPIIIDENLVGVIHYLIDIADLKKSQEKYIELADRYEKTIEKMKSHEQEIQKSKDAFFNMLEDVTESYRRLEDLFIKLITAMVNALDAKSSWTKGHSENVAKYAEELAKEVGLADDEAKKLKLAGLLHDIGKIGISDNILDKSGKLTDAELEIIKEHSSKGMKILEGIKQLEDIIPLIQHHHERIDGKGYPNGLKDDEIPVGAKIIHLLDSFDAMTSDRPYRKSPGIEYAISELKKHSGTQFDSKIVNVFLKILNKKEKKNK